MEFILVSVSFVSSRVCFLTGSCSILLAKLQCKYAWYTEKKQVPRDYDWVHQISPSSAPVEAFLSVALFPKEYISNTPANLQMYIQSFAFVELGMNLTICMLPPGRIPGLLQGKFFLTPTRKGGFLFLYNYCLI